MPVITNCKICGKEIKSPPSRVKETCSKECANLLMSQRRTTDTIAICQTCGREFHIKPSKKANAKYCSRICKAEAMKGQGEYKINFDMDEIKRLYIEEKWSAKMIADKMGTIKKNILSRLKDMGVDIRTTGQGRGLDMKKNGNPNDMPGIKEKQSNIQIAMNELDPGYARRRGVGVSNKWKSLSNEEKSAWTENMSKTKLNRTPEEVRSVMRKQYATKRKNGTFKCNGLEKKYEAILIRDDVTYLPQYTIPEGDMLYRYDFYLPDSNTLIEVNGEGTHADPSKYKAEDLIKLGIPGWKVRTAGEIWEEDRRKREYAEERGYTVITVWQKEL